MLRYLLAALAILLSGCATVERIPVDYGGTDAGRVVVGIGAASGTSYSSYSLFFQKTQSTPQANTTPPRGAFVYYQTNMFYKQKSDYESDKEAGVVLVQSLPPGEYEVFNFNVFFNAGMVQNNYSSRNPIAIRFSVLPGKTTYLGNYQANRLTGRNLFGMPLPAGAVFVVSSRAKSELAIAQAKDKNITAFDLEVTPDPKSIASPFFISPVQLEQVQ